MVLKLDLGQISTNLVENAFATQQLALLVTRIAFYDILALFAAVIDLLLGLLAVQKLLRKRHRGRQFFTTVKPGVVAGNFAPSFSLNFLSIFLRISQAP